jgi:hypothetical protein
MIFSTPLDYDVFYTEKVAEEREHRYVCHAVYVCRERCYSVPPVDIHVKPTLHTVYLLNHTRV